MTGFGSRAWQVLAEDVLSVLHFDGRLQSDRAKHHVSNEAVLQHSCVQYHGSKADSALQSSMSQLYPIELSLRYPN